MITAQNDLLVSSHLYFDMLVLFYNSDLMTLDDSLRNNYVTGHPKTYLILPPGFGTQITRFH